MPNAVRPFNVVFFNEVFSSNLSLISFSSLNTSICTLNSVPDLGRIYFTAARLEPKRLRFVRHSAASAVSLVLLEARLGGKPGLQIEPELVLYGPDGSESAACRRIYHRQE